MELELIDANRDDFDPDTVEIDLIGFPVFTSQAKRAYGVAESEGP